MRYQRYTCWLVILLLVRTTAPAFAQSQTQSSDPTPTIRLRHAPDVEHPVETPVLTGPSWEIQAGRPGTLRKLPRQVDTAKRDWPVDEGLGRNVSGGTRPRLS